MTTCEIYPDLYKKPPLKNSVSPDELAVVYNSNFQRLRLAHAVDYVLSQSFKLAWSIKDDFLKDAMVKVTAADPNRDQRIFFVSVLGLLLANNISDPSLGTQPAWAVIRSADASKRNITLSAPPPANIDGGSNQIIIRNFLLLDEATLDAHQHKQRVVLVRRFVDSVVDAVKEFQDATALFTKVFLSLREIGTNPSNEVGQPDTTTIYPRQVAEVTRQLMRRNVNAEDPQINHLINDALSVALGGGINSDPGARDIDIIDLDLDQGSTADVISANVQALAGIYYAAQLEDLKFFAVADKITEQFINGLVPITRGPAGGRIYAYHREAPSRFTEFERRSLYARTFGLAQGSVDEHMPNREFQDLWLRFLSATSLYNRQTPYQRTAVTDQQLFKSARDLAVNLSLHGYAVAHFAAVELQQLVRDVHAMLSDPEMVAAYGTRDVWQLVDRISIMHLGGSVNGVRNRTLAQSGGRIIKWLADHSAMLSSAITASAGDEFRQPNLVNDVERWLAVNGVVDTTVTQYAEPVISQAQPTIPNLGFNAGGSINDAFNSMNAIAGNPALNQPALTA